jgi:ribosomal protein S18 acetylase RimI-like enzyme
LIARPDLLPRLKARRAAPTDLPAMLALIADDVLGKNRDADASDPVYKEAFEAIEADQNQYLLVGELDDEVIAMLQITFIPGLSRRGALRANIEAVRVKSSLRSQGIGQWLMQIAIEISRERGCALVQLTSDARRIEARSFYERLEFVGSHVGFKLPLEALQS